jgi:hypothetical protein
MDHFGGRGLCERNMLLSGEGCVIVELTQVSFHMTASILKISQRRSVSSCSRWTVFFTEFVDT